MVFSVTQLVKLIKMQESLDLDEKWLERRVWTSEWKLKKRNGKRGKINITSLTDLVENTSH
jgi:hypothetical protein